VGRVVSKEQCPSCASKGNDRSGNNLARYEDGGAHCFSCGFRERKGGGEPYEQKKSRPMTDISKFQAYPVRALKHKPISKEICEKYGVKASISVETGAIEGVLYPYYEGTKLAAYKLRQLPKDIRWVGDGGKTGLFGQQLFKSGKMLMVTEGEDDTLAVAEMLRQKGKSYSVVSIPNGADQNGVIDKRVKEQYEYFLEFEIIVICMDNDKPGIATATALADWLAPCRKVRIMDIPVDNGWKDAADMLVDGKTEEFWKLLSAAREYSPEGIVAGTEITLEDLKKPLKTGYSTPYPALDDKMKGIRKQELTLLCAGSGIGKSTIAREFGYHLTKVHGLKIANIFLEESMDKTALSYIAIDNNVPLPRLRMRPDCISSEDFEKSYNELVASGRNYFFRHFGSLDNDKIMNKFRYFANALEVDFIILDHISMVISGQEVGDERKTIDLLMTNLAAFVNETGVGVIAVVHLKRRQGGKDKSFNEGGQVSLTDLRGSGGLEQMSWNVLALERNQQDMEEANFSQLRILKSREHGFLGEADRLFFNPETGRLLPHEVEPYYDEKNNEKD